jgi:hypothetical protein
VDDEPWSTPCADAQRPWRAAVVQLSNRVKTTWYKPQPLEQARTGAFAVSRRGGLVAADVVGADETRYTIVSMYGLWEISHPPNEGNKAVRRRRGSSSRFGLSGVCWTTERPSRSCRWRPQHPLWLRRGGQRLLEGAVCHRLRKNEGDGSSIRGAASTQRSMRGSVPGNWGVCATAKR